MAIIPVASGQSIQAAVDAASPGDTILVEPGVYAAGIVVTEPNITLRSSEKWGAVIDGGYAVANGIQAKGDADGLIVDGFEIRNLREHGNSSSCVELYSAGRGSKVLDNHLHHVGQNQTSISNGQSGVVVRQDDVLIEGNYIHDIGRTTSGDVSRDHGIYANGGGGGAGLIIRDNYFGENIEHGWGIQLYPGSWDDFSILDNQFVGGNPDRDNTHIVLNADLVGEMLGNVFWAAGPSETLHGSGGSWDIDFAGNVTTGSKWSDDQLAGLNFGAENVLNAQIPKPLPPTADELPPPALVPPALSVGAVTNTAVTLTWPALPVTGYRFYKNGAQVSTGGPLKTSVKFGALPQEVTVLGVEAVYTDGAALASKTTHRNRVVE